MKETEGKKGAERTAGPYGYTGAMFNLAMGARWAGDGRKESKKAGKQSQSGYQVGE